MKTLKHTACTIGWVVRLSQLVFPRDSNPNFPWEKIQMGQYSCKKKKKSTKSRKCQKWCFFETETIIRSNTNSAGTLVWGDDPAWSFRTKTQQQKVVAWPKFKSSAFIQVPGFPTDLVLLTIGYAPVFVLFLYKCGETYVERGDGRVAWGDSAVSYTHLTLPTRRTV